MRFGNVFRALVDDDAPVAFRAYDGSATGPRDPLATIEVRSPEAVRFMLTAPGQLGVARAYVTGALEVHGDLHATLRALHAHRRRDNHAGELLRLLRGFEKGRKRRPRGHWGSREVSNYPGHQPCIYRAEQGERCVTAFVPRI